MGRRENTDDREPSRIAEYGASFGELANTTRLEVVQSLAAGETPVGYTELFEQVAVDDRGQFNYHLRQLVDTYVRKTGDGYRLTQSGARAANVLASNALQRGEDQPFERIDSQCGACGHAAVEIGYRDGEAIVRCPDCERRLTRFDFPSAAAASAAPDAFAHAFARRTEAYFRMADDGVCPFCAHALSTELRPTAATHADDVPVVCHCSTCPAGIRGPVGLLLANRPRVQSLFAEAGVSFRETPFWEFDWCTFDAPAVQETDPLVTTLTIEIGDSAATVLVNERLEILEFDR